MRENKFQKIYDTMSNTNPQRAFQDPIEFPKELHVELVNTCNIHCPFCPSGQKELKRPIGKMNEPLWWGICTEAQEYKSSIRLVRWGEPTLHIKCFDYIKMATKIGIPVHLNTNGVNLDVKQVLDSGLDSIKISLHTQDAWESVNKLVKARGDREKPFITVAQLSSEIGFWDAGRFHGNKPSITADQFTYHETVNLKETGRTPKSCWELYNRLSIDWDGTVVACCGDYDHFMTLGHIYDHDTLKEIWDGKTLQYYRELEQSGKLGECKLCERCAR